VAETNLLLFGIPYREVRWEDPETGEPHLSVLFPSIGKSVLLDPIKSMKRAVYCLNCPIFKATLKGEL